MTTLTSGTIDQFLASLSVRGHSPETVRAYSQDLRHLHDVSGDVDEAGLEHAAALWLTEGRKTWAARTTARRLTSVRSWARWAGIPKLLADYRLPDPGKPQPHPIPEGQEGIQRLLDACGRNMQHRALIVLCGKLALRVSEARSVTPESFDFIDNLLRVRGKGDRVRTLPVPSFAWPDLAPAIGGARLRGDALVPFSDRHTRRIITMLGERAGLSRALSSHDLRATAATHIYRVTKDPRVVQEILGHADLASGQVYTEISMSTMRDALEAGHAA